MLTVENIFTEYDDVVKLKDLQKMLSIGRSTALKLLQNRKIKSAKVGNEYRIPKIYIIDYLNSNTNNSKSA